MMIMSVFFTTEACLFQVVTICIQWRSASSETWTGSLRMNCRFRPPKSVQEEDSLLVQSKPKSTQYKDKWAVAGTAEGEGLVGPRPHHFFAPLPPLSALKEK